MNFSMVEMQSQFSSGETRSMKWRRNGLLCFRKLILENEKAMINASCEDFKKHHVETIAMELSILLREVDQCIWKLAEWMSPIKTRSGLLAAPCVSHMIREPRGVSLVIGPSNFPLFLLLGPVVASVAAGCPVVMKPSELCPATSRLIADLVPAYVPSHVATVVEGGVKEASALLKNPGWGLIYFTGSMRVGTVVAKAAAETLTPCVLELGGKNPVYVDEHVPDLTVTATRLAWGGTMNGGQVCLRPDYILCHEHHVAKFTILMEQVLEEMYTKTPDKSCLGRLIQKSHAERHIEMLREVKEAGAKIITIGTSKPSIQHKFIPPTIVLNPPLDSRLMTEEIFGPIIPILTVSSCSDAIHKIRQISGSATPLSLYVFTTSDAVFSKVLDACPSGNAMRNDVIMQTSGDAPFGGLGTSGHGRGFGKYAFDSFTHDRPVSHSPCLRIFEFGNLRYPPYDKFFGYSGDILVYLSKTLPPFVPILHTAKIAMSLLFALAINYLPKLHSGVEIMMDAGVATFDSLPTPVKGFILCFFIMIYFDCRSFAIGFYNISLAKLQ